MDRESTMMFLKKHAKTDGLIALFLGVEAAMKSYTRKLGLDPAYGGVTGLVNDCDWGMAPCPEDHPMYGVAPLRNATFPEDII